MLTEAVVAARGQILRCVRVMRTGAMLAGPESLDFRSQSQPAPEELLIGNATVLVRPQFPHQLLHRILQIQFPAHRQQILAKNPNRKNTFIGRYPGN